MTKFLQLLAFGGVALAVPIFGACNADQVASSQTSICLDDKQLGNLEKQADQGDFFAMRKLETYFGSCLGDKKKTDIYVERAAEIGTSDDVNVFAHLVERTSGSEKAFPLFLKAANMNNSSAKLWVARAYRDGNGVQKNQEEALHWFEKGASCQEFGTNDMEELAQFIWIQKPVPLSGIKAFAWLTVVNKHLGLYLDNKKLYDEIARSLSKDELSIAEQVADEYEQQAGCTQE
jgi:hypothetical protein